MNFKETILKNILKFLLSLVLAFSFSVFAMADNFSGTSDSFQAVPDSQLSLYGMQFAKAGAKKQVEDEPDSSTVSAFDNGKLFLQVYGGYDFSFLGDLVTGSNGWINYAKTLGYTSTGGSEQQRD